MRDFSLERLDALLTDPRWFLRHDVDVSPSAARKMAYLESRIGVVGTYYLMWDSPFYSAAQALRLAVFLAGLGHRVGAHVDMRKLTFADISSLFPGAPVSLHCPRGFDVWQTFPSFEYAYDTRWKGRYYADSRGSFAHGDPEDHPIDEKVQLNLHPVWWFEPDWYEDVDDDLYESFFREPKSLLVGASTTKFVSG